MNCSEFSRLSRDLAAGAEPSFAASAHLNSCPDCRSLLHRDRQLEPCLAALRAEMAGLQAPSNVEARLLAAFRSPASRPPSRPPARLRRWVPAAAAVLAAAFLLLPQQTPAPAPAPPPQVSVAPAVEHPVPAQSRAVSARTVRHARTGAVSRLQSAAAPIGPARPAAHPADPPESSRFYPLVYGDPYAGLESFRIMRVELPARAFSQFGIPVSGRAFERRIPAEVLLGGDGVPRAVRLVADPTF